MTTAQDDRSFINDVVNTTLLEKSIEWISSNMHPDEVFSKEELVDWAVENMTLEQSVEVVSSHTEYPDEVFPVESLEAWALDNGFKKE